MMQSDPIRTSSTNKKKLIINNSMLNPIVISDPIIDLTSASTKDIVNKNRNRTPNKRKLEQENKKTSIKKIVVGVNLCSR